MTRVKKDNKIKPVIIPEGHPNPPETHEVATAWILARHYNTTIEFLIPVDDYKRKTADIIMLGHEWEIKSPTGRGKRAIENQLKRAAKQSKYIIFDGRRTRINDGDIIQTIYYELGKRRTVKRLIFITKSADVLELK